MPQILVVTSNCQTAGIAAALQLLFPMAEVVPLPATNISRAERGGEEAAAIAAADFWISSEGFTFAAIEDAEIEARKIPFASIRFRGFHPDLLYIGKKDEPGAIFEPHYNSAIVAWTYLNGIPNDVAAKLFRREVFEALGYFNSWHTSTKHLIKEFEVKGLDGKAFMAHVQRHGVFMHSINHPKPPAISFLAKLIATKITEDRDVIGRDIEVPDTLGGTDWPIYPELGEYYSLPSGYLFTYKGRIFANNLDHLIERSYAEYKRQNIDNNNAILLGVAKDFSKTLREFV